MMSQTWNLPLIADLSAEYTKGAVERGLRSKGLIAFLRRMGEARSPAPHTHGLIRNTPILVTPSDR